jgi:hypothetical protein
VKHFVPELFVPPSASRSSNWQSQILVLGVISWFSCEGLGSKRDGGNVDSGPDTLQCAPLDVLNRHCATAGCHDAAPTAAASLDLLSPNIERRLLNRRSLFRRDYFLIDSEIPEESALLAKVNPPVPYGGQMPPGPALSQEDKMCLARWVNQVSLAGAPDGAVVTADGGVDAGKPVSDAGPVPLLDGGVFFGPAFDDAGCAPGAAGFCIAQIVPAPLYAIKGTSATNAWAVGARGAAYRLNGSTWNRVDTGTTSTLFDVFVFPDGGALAVGERGLILRFSGNSWAPLSYGPSSARDAGVNANGSTGYDLGGIFSIGNITWAVGVGGTLVEINGNTATVRRSSKLDAPEPDFLRVFAQGPTEWWAVGDYDNIFRSTDGVNWNKSKGGIARFFGIWGVTQNPSNAPLLVGACDDGRLLSFDYMAPSTESYPWQPPSYDPRSAGVQKDLRALWFDESSRGVAVGLDGTILEINLGNAKRFVRQVSPTFDHLLGVWGSSQNAVWAVGGRSTGVILKSK